MVSRSHGAVRAVRRAHRSRHGPAPTGQVAVRPGQVARGQHAAVGAGRHRTARRVEAASAASDRRPGRLVVMVQV